jgi:signal transduction histidine kinase
MNARSGTPAPTHIGSAREFESLGPSIRAMAEMLRACVGAEICLIAIEESDGRGGVLFGTHEAPSERGSAARQALLDLPAEALVFTGPLVQGAATRRAAAAVAALAQRNQLNSFVCLPLSAAGLNARLCFASAQRSVMSAQLVDLTRLAEQVSIVMKSIHFGGRLAMDLARHERRQISRDLHDSAIQAIIGLKLGLEALRRRLAREDHLVKDLDYLIAIAGAGVGELREYVGALKAAPASSTVGSLASTVRCQAKKFSALYGIEATVIASGEVSISAPMQHEVIQIIREGLSNIRRHTVAKQAAIHLGHRRGRLLLEISNDHGGPARPRSAFRPRSICERAKELGGRVRVKRRNGHTVVVVDLPIQ